jgi:hypothetical protein
MHKLDLKLKCLLSGGTFLKSLFLWFKDIALGKGFSEHGDSTPGMCVMENVQGLTH